MRRFVFGTGLVSVLAGIGFQFAVVSRHLMPSAQPGMLLHLFGLMAIFLGVMLCFCSRDLAHRGGIVLWEGVLRLGGFVVMGGYALLCDGGASVALGGLFDLAIGLVYLVGLPRHLGVSLVDLMLDRPRTSSGV